MMDGDQNAMVALPLGQPAGVDRSFGQIGQYGEAGQHRGDTSDHEQPLPRGQMSDIAHGAHDESGQGAADNAGYRERCHEQTVDAGTPLGGKPERDVEHDAGEKAGFEHAQQKAQGVELHRRFDKRHGDGGQAPQYRDACQRSDVAPRVEFRRRKQSLLVWGIGRHSISRGCSAGGAPAR